MDKCDTFLSLKIRSITILFLKRCKYVRNKKEVYKKQIIEKKNNVKFKIHINI